MSDELVVIATSENVMEAEFLENHLRDEGFDVFIADNNIVGANAFLAPAVGWIKIKVPQSQAEEAKAFVEELRNAEIVYDDEFPENQD
jgi:hypothetical protein